MWSTIKSILNSKTGKCLIIEDGAPKYVLLNFEEYQQLQKRENSDTVPQRPPRGENSWEVGEDTINGEIQEMREGEEGEASPPTVKLEDLPF